MLLEIETLDPFPESLYQGITSLRNNLPPVEVLASLSDPWLDGKPSEEIWTALIDLIEQNRHSRATTPTFTQLPSFLSVLQKSTPFKPNTGSIVTISETREIMDPVLYQELANNLLLDVPHLETAVFRKVENLDEITEDVFTLCQTANESAPERDTQAGLYKNGKWDGRPLNSKEEYVLAWLQKCTSHFWT